MASHSVKAVAVEKAGPAILLALPVELLEYICELAYAPNVSEVRAVDLLDPHPPTKALLLTCTQTLSVARYYYFSAYRRFWTSHDFVIDARKIETTMSDVWRKLHQQRAELDHLTSLRAIAPNGTLYDLAHKRGGWKVTKPSGGQLYIRMRVAVTRGMIDPAHAAWDGHGTVESLSEACEEYPSKVPFVDQIYHTLRPDFSPSTTPVF